MRSDSISLWAAVGGIVLFVVIGIPLCIWTEFAIYVVPPSFLILEISALVACLVEWPRKSAKLGLVASIAGIAIAVAVSRAQGIEFGGILLLCIVVTPMAVFAGIKAVTLRETRLDTWTLFLVLWLIPLLLANIVFSLGPSMLLFFVIVAPIAVLGQGS